MIDFDSNTFNINYLKKIKSLIKNASFIAIDCEFTSVSRQSHIFDFDSQKKVYEKYKEVVKDSELLQLGLTIFQNKNEKDIENENENEIDSENKNGKDDFFEINCFNFNLFKDKRSRKKHVKAENSCLYFLGKYHFSFRKCFFDGIDYKSLEEIKYYQNFLKNNLEENSENLEKIEDFEYISLSEEKKNKKLFSQMEYPKKSFYKEEKELIKKYYKFLESDNWTEKFDIDNKEFVNYLGSPKSLLYNIIHNENKISLKGKKKGFLFKKKTEYQMKNDFEKLKKEEKNFFDHYNFSLIFHFIHLYKKKVIFHNGLYDYMYIFENLIGKLPEKFEDFYSLQFFDQIYDTKNVTNSFEKEVNVHGNKTQLLHLFHKFSKNLDFEKFFINTKKVVDEVEKEILEKEEEKINENENKKNENNKVIKKEIKKKEIEKKENFFYEINFPNDNYHQAGYDSLITGIVFIFLQKTIKKRLKHEKNILAEKHLKKFYLKDSIKPKYVNLYYRDHFEKNSFFIKIKKNIEKNLKENLEEESFGENLICDIGEFGAFTVDNKINDIIFIKFKKIEEKFVIKDFVEFLKVKYDHLDFYMYKDFIENHYD